MNLADDDYELLPHKEIESLKNELEKLKKGPSDQTKTQMGQLTDSINNLLNLFKEAASQMHLEEQEADMVSQKIIPIEMKLDQVLEQNQKIAEGIIALADIIKEMKGSPPPSMPRPMMGSMGLPPRMPPQRQGGLPPMPPFPQ